MTFKPDVTFGDIIALGSLFVTLLAVVVAFFRRVNEIVMKVRMMWKGFRRVDRAVHRVNMMWAAFCEDHGLPDDLNKEDDEEL